jgi:hypothetical protein
VGERVSHAGEAERPSGAHKWPIRLRQAVDSQAEDLVLKLIRGQTKLRLFPSGQSSVAGIRFISKRVPERLLELGLIQRTVVNRKGVWLHAPSERAQSLFGATAAVRIKEPCGTSLLRSENETR